MPVSATGVRRTAVSVIASEATPPRIARAMAALSDDSNCTGYAGEP